MDETVIPPVPSPKYRRWALPTIAVILIIVIVLSATYLLYVRLHPRHTQSPYVTQTVNTVLEGVNPDFVSGMAALNASDYTGALADFKVALPKAQDASQESLITYFIGLSQEYLGNYADAIASYKAAVAVGASANRIVRSYAALSIAEMHMTYFNDGPAIASTTFTGDPYASFVHPGDPNLNPAYLRFYEYAASIYPTALAESFVAYGYALDLISINGATTTTRGANDVQQTLAALQATDADFKRMMQNPDEANQGSVVLLRKASVYWALEQYGVPGYTKDQADAAWQSAFQATAQQPKGTILNDFTAEMYANYLVDTYGESRNADVQSLLSRFSVSTKGTLPPLVLAYFTQSRTDSTMTYFKDELTLMGQADSDFKAFLISVGWKASDFDRHIDASTMPALNARSDTM